MRLTYKLSLKLSQQIFQSNSDNFSEIRLCVIITKHCTTPQLNQNNVAQSHHHGIKTTRASRKYGQLGESVNVIHGGKTAQPVMSTDVT